MKKHIKARSIAITLGIIALLAGASIYLKGDYGLVVFLLSPLLIGFLPAYLIGFERPIQFREGFLMGLLTLGLAMLGLLVFALEGIICIFMASPLMLLEVLIGAIIAQVLHRKRAYTSPSVGAAMLLLVATASFGFDEALQQPTLFPVTTSVVAHAPIAEVWDNVVTFGEIQPPEGWFFKTGIAYPINATIEGRCVGAVRHCNFTTGSFVEPITVWDEPNLLAFDVTEQPIPMDEMNPFWDIHPPHLDGYFLSEKGQFKLTQLAENETLLEGTTWYTVNLQPEWYWKLWSDEIIHRIHGRVLGHIKNEVER